MNIYLSGGTKSGWQQRVKEYAPEFFYADPSQCSLTDPAEYTEWDLRHIRECDVVLANMEATNQSGHGLILEIGYAHALGKRILLVDEKGLAPIVLECCEMFSTLRDAIACLRVADKRVRLVRGVGASCK